MTKLKQFLTDTRGSVAIEYSVVGSLVSVAIIGSVVAFTGGMEGVYDQITAAMSGALGSSDT